MDHLRGYSGWIISEGMKVETKRMMEGANAQLFDQKILKSCYRNIIKWFNTEFPLKSIFIVISMYFEFTIFSLKIVFKFYTEITHSNVSTSGFHRLDPSH